MNAEYIVKIGGNISSLEKVIKKAQGQVKRISDDEVLIKLAYDGNLKEFNKTFNQVLKSSPELTVQFQYDVNKKILNQELEKLQQLTTIKMDIETGNASAKLKTMLKSLQDSYDNIESEQILHSKMEEILKYANTLKSLGVNLDKSGLEVLEEYAEDYKSLDALLQKNETNPITLFKLDKSLDKTIENTTKNVQELQSTIEKLKENGATELSENSEFKELSDKVKILSSDLEDMKQQLGSLSGEAFEEMSRSVDTLESKLSNALTRLQELREATVNPNDITYHIGDFEDGPHRLKSESYNHIISNMNWGGFDEGDFGYGILGTGVYHTPDASELKMGGANKKGYAIDLSKYKLFVASLDEEAERLMTFLGQMQGFVVAQGSSYREWDDILKKKNVNSETLYTQFKNIFGNTVMSVQEFEGFLDEMIAQMNEISAGGLQVGEKAGDFKDLPAKYDHFDTAITQLMKRLGYEGIDLRGTQYDNYNQGNTIFDLHPEDIIKTFNTQEELDTYWENNKKAIEKFNTASAQALGEAGKNIQNLTEYVEELNKRLETLAETVSALGDLSGIKDAAEAMSGAAVAGIQQGQHSHSPSVDGGNEGDNLVNGYVNSINEGTEKARAAGENLSKAAVAGLSETSTQDIENQLNSDFSEATQSQEKFELAIINTNNELQRMAELAFRADTNVNEIDRFANQSQVLKAQALETERIAREEAERTAEIARQNAEYERQQEILRGAAEAAFRMDTGQTGANQFNKLLNDSYKQTQLQVDETVRITQAQMEQTAQMEKQYDLAKNFENAISDYADEISRAEGNAEELAAAMQKAIDISRNADAGSSLELLSSLHEANLQEQQARENMSSQVGKWTSQIESLQKSSKYTQEFQQYLEDTLTTLKSFNSATGSIEEVNAAFEKLDATMKDIGNNKGLAEFKRAQETSIAKLNLQIEEFTRKNSRMGADFQKRFANLKLDWDTEHTLAEVQQLVVEFNKLKQEVTAAGKTGASFFDTLRQRAMGVNAQLIAQFLSWQDLLRYVRQAIDVVKDLDYALVDLKKTTTMTTSELNDFYYGANDIAKQMGVTTEEIINQAAAWSRLGYSSQEAATEMAALSSQFAQISPGMDIDLATDGLVSTMKAFHVDVANVERDVMDVINKTGNTMATTNEEIVEMLKRSSAAMSAANNTIEETIALESAAVQITRNAETTGTAFRTISMRIRGYDEETEEYIGGIEELTGKVADLTKTASTPGGISLFTDETKSTYKSTYQILKDISEIYNELSDADQAALLETLAGKRGGQVLAGILEDFSEVERAMENMEKAAGSADAEMSIVEESIDYKLNNLQQTWVGIIQELIDNGMLGQLIDALTAISEVLGSIITTLGPVPSILAGLGVRELLLNLDRIPGVIKAIQGGLGAGGILSSMFGADVDEMLEQSANAADSAFGSNLEGIGKIFTDVTENASEMSEVVEEAFDSNSLEGIGKIFTDTTEAVSETVDTVSEMSESAQSVIENIQNLEGVFGEVTETAEGTAEAVEAIGESAGGAGVSGATKLANAFKALGPILTNPITIMAALAVATYALYKWVDEANDRQRDKIKGLQKEFNSLENELDSTNNELSNVEKQIEEIQSKGTISLVEQQELDRLRTQAELLKVARMEQEELLKLKAQELTTENSKLFNSVYGDINADVISNPEEWIQGYDQMVGDQVKFSYGEQLSSALESAAKGDYNDSPNELLSIFQQIQEAREGALKTIEEYGSRVTKLNEEELAAFEGAKEVIADTAQYMSGLGIQIGKVKTELLSMKDSASRAGTDEGNALVEQINGALKLVYQYSDTGREWNAMQIGSIFDNSELEKSRQELEAMAAAGELNESTIKQYPKLREEISKLDLILGDGETAFSLFKNELLASAEAAKQVDEELSNALDSAKSWESERDAALEKLGLAKEGRDGIEYDESWTNYLETIKQLNPELANNEEAVEKCALANMQFSTAIDDLSKNFASYKEALQDGNALTPEYSNAINALADDLTYLTGINFSISEASDFLGDANNLELLEQAINGSDEALQQLQDHASQSIRIKIDVAAVEDLRKTVNTTLDDVKKELEELGKGGNVDLTLRPKIDTQLLRDVGWDKVEEVAGEYATVFTKTFSNEAEDVAVNFTPIIVDENGNYVDVMEPDAFTRYCEGVIAGTREDDLKLQIGAEFTGEDAIDQAEAAAMRIHNLHELQIELGLDTTEFNSQFTGLVDWLETADLGTLEAQTYLNEDPFIQALIHLANESEEMAAKIKQIFAELGWEIKWDTKKMPVPKETGSHITSTYGKTYDSDGNPHYVNGGFTRWEWEYLDVPTNVRFERTGGAGGRRSSTSGYTPRSMSPSQKSGAASNLGGGSSGGGGGGSDQEKEDDYKENIDYFERFIKILDQQIDLLDAHLQDVVGSFAKNMILDAEEDAIKKKMAGYSSAVEMYSQKAAEALSKIPGEIAEKVQSGAVAIDEFIGEGNKDVVDAINDYQGWADKVAECKQQIVELREALRQLELQKFNNIAQDFQELFDVRNTQIDLISKAITLFETSRDKTVGRAFYDESIEQTEKQLTDLYAKHTALSKQMTKAIAAGVNVAGDEWLSMVDAIEKVNAEILDAQTNVEKYKNAIIQLYVEAFDNESNYYSSIVGTRQKAIDSLERQIALMEASGQLAGKSLYDRQINEMTKQISDLEIERNTLVTRLNDAMANGVKRGTDEWKKMVDEIYNVDAAIQETQTSIKQTEQAIKKLYLARFQKAAGQYDNAAAIRDKASSAIGNEITRLQTAGQLVGESYYQAQRAQAKKTSDILVKERKELVKRLNTAVKKGVEVGSDEWNTMVDKLYEVDAGIQQCKTSMEEFDNAILELHTATFERIQARFDSFGNELSNMAEAFSDKEVATTDNKWTEAGIAQLGLQAQQYELAKKRVADYNEEIGELNEQYQKGKYSVTEYIERLSKLKSEQWNQVKSAESARKAILELNRARVEKVVEGINDEVDAYQKLIKAEKDALSQSKELHDYEKSLQESTKNVTDIERQIAALEGDTSLSAMAKRKELEAELSDARQSLAELEYQHSIDTQQAALDQQLENYQTEREAEIEQLQLSLEDANTILAESFETVRGNAEAIGIEILAMAQQLNIDMSPELTAPWQAGETAIGSYSDLFNQQTSAFMTQMSQVENSEWRLQDQANRSGESILGMLTQDSTNLVNQILAAKDNFEALQKQAEETGKEEGKTFSKKSNQLVKQLERAKEKQDELTQASEESSRALADAFGNRADDLVATILDARNSASNLNTAAQIAGGTLKNTIDGSYSGASATNALGSIEKAADGVKDSADAAAKALGNMLEQMSKVPSDGGGGGSEHVTSIYGGEHAGQVAVWRDNSDGTRTLIGYRAHGSKGLPHDEISWTQENGPEAIINPATGAILTPLEKGSAVLPADQTKNIWEWSRFNPSEFANKLAQNINNTGVAPVQTNTMQVGALVQVNGNINDTMEMMQIAATQASTKIKQSFKQLSNGLTG